MTDLRALHDRLASAISSNEEAMKKLDRQDRIRLLPITDKLRRYRDRIVSAKPHELPELRTMLGKNMRGPAIDDLIRQSESIRENASVKIAA